MKSSFGQFLVAIFILLNCEMLKQRQMKQVHEPIDNAYKIIESKNFFYKIFRKFKPSDPKHSFIFVRNWTIENSIVIFRTVKDCIHECMRQYSHKLVDILYSLNKSYCGR